MSYGGSPMRDDLDMTPELGPSLDYGLQSGGVSRDDLDLLKADIHTCLNDALFRKLHDIEQVGGEKFISYQPLNY